MRIYSIKRQGQPPQPVQDITVSAYGPKNQFQGWVYLKIPSNRITFWYPFHVSYSETYKIKQLISQLDYLDNHIWKSMDIKKKKTITSILKPTYTNLFTEKIKIQIYLPPNLSAHKQGGIWKFTNLHAKKKYFNLWGFIHTPFQGALWGIFFTKLYFEAAMTIWLVAQTVFKWCPSCSGFTESV